MVIVDISELCRVWPHLSFQLQQVVPAVGACTSYHWTWSLYYLGYLKNSICG